LATPQVSHVFYGVDRERAGQQSEFREFYIDEINLNAMKTTSLSGKFFDAKLILLLCA